MQGTLDPYLSHLSSPGRLERHIVAEYIYPAMNDPLPETSFDDQFAFRPTGSATAALINLISIITNLLRSGKTVVLISLDFSKAFDRVKHQTLFQKYSRWTFLMWCIIGWLHISMAENTVQNLWMMFPLWSRSTQVLCRDLLLDRPLIQ